MRALNLNLGRRKDGMYQKKIDGKLHYFGWVGCSESEARKELIEFLRLRESGQSLVHRSDVPIHEIANHYIADVQPRVQRATFDDYDRAIKDFIAVVGRGVLDTQLTPAHFSKVRDAWSERLGEVRLGNQVQAIRTMFKWAVEHLIIEKQPSYGNAFSKPTATEVRIERREIIDKRGVRKFSTDQIAAMLVAAREPLKTFILLGLNAGMYSVDISDIHWPEVTRDGSLWVIDRLRAKTKIPQRFVLWPELAKRFSRMERGTGRVFSTIHGNPWNNRETHTDSINQRFIELRAAVGMECKGVGFGSMRHTHTSAVGSHSDSNAARVVRGHLVEGIELHYDIPANDRLKSVTDLARKKLLNSVALAAAGVVES